jgi:hypothetical protein
MLSVMRTLRHVVALVALVACSNQPSQLDPHPSGSGSGLGSGSVTAPTVRHYTPEVVKMVGADDRRAEAGSVCRPGCR